MSVTGQPAMLFRVKEERAIMSIIRWQEWRASIMYFSGRVSRVVGTVLGICFFVPTANAEESGNYQSVASFTYDYVKFNFAGQTIISGPLHGSETITGSTGPLFEVGRSSTLTCAVYGKKSTAGMDLEAPCISVDSDGDELYVIARRRVGDTESGGGGDGQQEIAGGTGKYTGVTGSCTYTAEYLPGNRAVSVTSCHWSKP
jgi:hypothetical protein